MVMNLNKIIRKEIRETPSTIEQAKDEAQEKLSLVEYWYGKDAKPGKADSTSEGMVKIEYASILWLPIYCPSQPVVLVTCPAFAQTISKISWKTHTED